MRPDELKQLMEEELNLSIELGEDQNEVIIRHGQARKKPEPQQLSVAGTIETPYEYYEKMCGKEHMDFSNAVIKYTDNPDNTEIILLVDPNNPLATTIRGSMMNSEEVKTLGINQDKQFDNLSLARKFRMNRSYFKDLEVNTDLVHKLSEFTAEIEAQRKNHDDDKGTRRVAVELVCKTKLPSDFDLKIPFFKGVDPEPVTVQLMYQYKNEKVRFWLESPELREEKRQIASKAIDQQLQRFQNNDKDGIPILHVR